MTALFMWNTAICGLSIAAMLGSSMHWNSFSCKLKTGQQSDMWLRYTGGLRKMNGNWLIVHDHVSVPVDFERGKVC